MKHLLIIGAGLFSAEVEELAHHQGFIDIVFHDFQLFCEDIAGKRWAEVDTVDDLLTAQEIHRGN